MNKRKTAVITGNSLLLMAIVAGFSFGYAYPIFDDPEQGEFLKDNILQNRGLYQGMLAGILAIILLDFIVSFTLYKYFEDDHKRMSMISGVIRAVYTLIFGIATYYLTQNHNTNELTNQVASSNFEQFQTLWNSGLVVFGFHIVLIGVLMKLHKRIPNILWYITLIAGISYVVVSLLTLKSPDSDMVKTLVMILALPMTLGEVGLAIWLLGKGGRAAAVNNPLPTTH